MVHTYILKKDLAITNGRLILLHPAQYYLHSTQNFWKCFVNHVSASNTNCCMSQHQPLHVPTPTVACPNTNRCMSQHQPLHVPTSTVACPNTNRCMSQHSRDRGIHQLLHVPTQSRGIHQQLYVPIPTVLCHNTVKIHPIGCRKMALV